MTGGIRAALMLACVALAGCVSEDGESAPTRSSLPRITVVPPPPVDESALLSEADVRAVDGLGDAVAGDLGDIDMYEDPDPRGPCGAPVDPTPAPDGGRVFTAGSASLYQLVFRDTGTIEGLMDAYAADFRPGCGPHVSRTPTGAIQTVSESIPVDMTGIGDRAMAWMSTVTLGETTFHGGSAVVVAGGRATILQLIADEVDGEQLVALARAAAVRARG